MANDSAVFEILQASSDLDMAKREAEQGNSRGASNILKGVVLRLKSVMISLK